MIDEWITSAWSELAMVVLSGTVTYGAILAYTRIVGLRSFSKISAADFAMTIAVGSLFASTMSGSTPTLSVGLVAIATLFGGQWLVAFLRRSSSTVGQIVDNQPILLMSKGRMLEDNMRKSNVTRADIYGKLREANAINLDEVLAVIFETTGDISVLHSKDPDAKLAPELLEGVAGKEALPPDLLAISNPSA
ncbi:DUF421 domain-containing protein [Blastopirellula marina]|uniref:YetF C-terminal domain-containing protein n=1 Tax=Blastopirellula marina DSM 3645 TaxID=314230 RepID=A3ZXX6_9BACT|nr:YetF domain-containing protein [Blastopirellula marina]EAQ78687.1 hypothetical protein DSM3645_07840 [Blastopirellula marina DSM 3645]